MKLKSLLVVDNEKLVRWSIQESLTRENFRVISAHDGYDALEKLEKERFDVVITDLVMPGVDGIQVARKAKELYPDSKVVMISAYGSVVDIEEAQKAGVSDFIGKPFLVSEVRSIVSKLLCRS